MEPTLYDVVGRAGNDVRVPLAGDLASYLEADVLAERYSRDPLWKRVTVRDTDTGVLVRSYAGGKPETVGMVQLGTR